MFKKYFIPHQGNQHQPHLLRGRAVLVSLAVLLLVEAAFLAQILLVWPLSNVFSSILPGVLVELTNQSRLQNNIAPLKYNLLLEQAAQLKAQDMAAKGYFDHVSPEGATPWSWLQKVGYRFSGAGENLAINFVDSSDIERAWLNSPGHRANILESRFSEIGIATAKGMYQGKETTFVVQFFGRPAGSVQSTLTIKPSISAKPSVLATPLVATSNNSGPTTVSSSVAGATQVDDSALASLGASPWRQWLTMPNAITNIIYLAVAAVFAAALALKIFVKIKIQYPKLIFNGIMVLFVIISLLYLNYLIVGQGLQSQIYIFN